MPKFTVYGVATATIAVGKYEAANKEEALEMANKDENANWCPSLCWQCANEVEIGDVYEEEVVEDE